ncbi:unnamed protein product [Rotaria sp. Silwood2]|nr:unnamed protein product [Rotaria sp. Silwood2]CAF3310758.1 unnamed protein product [Rotaria sp. Silwood2]CAF4339624.1 unnamed protein product [Rotaria sp. Silwood2]CAF4569246.1 unnamed protein product [Rotaria sp. Silwood2]
MNTITIVAGQTDVTGSTSKYLRAPNGTYADRISAALYVADTQNNRIQKWSSSAQDGITVAGSSTSAPDADAESLTAPYGIFVDEQTEVLYVADTANNRVQRWIPNALQGDTIVGGQGMNIVFATSLQ